VFQGFWLYQSYDLKEEDFHHKVSRVLQQVADNIASYNETELPKSKLIQRRSSNYYSVNVNSAIDANILEDYLVRAFTDEAMTIEFEYAVYDCANDEYLYSNYCNLSEQKDNEDVSTSHPKFDDLIYYFVVKFPSRSAHIIKDLKTPILFSLLTMVSILSFMYAIWVILRQKQATDLQKDFINNMTHEFKTPISSIKLASDYLLKNKTIQEDNRLNKYADIISQQNSRLNNQVEKVLNLVRSEKDHFKLNNEKINLQDFILKIIEQERIKFENNGGDIEAKVSTDTIYVTADKLHFTNVLTNILDNALKYCKTNPHVIVSVKEIKDFALLAIKDNGIGMAKEDVKKVFDKFFRISTGDVHDVKGFGLGLFYVKNICDAQGWTIDINSEIKKGTTFLIKIPIIIKNYESHE